MPETPGVEITSKLVARQIDTEVFFANGELLYRKQVFDDSSSDEPIAVEASKLDSEQLKQSLTKEESTLKWERRGPRILRYGGLGGGAAAELAIWTPPINGLIGRIVLSAMVTAIPIATEYVRQREKPGNKERIAKAQGRIALLNNVMASLPEASEVEA
jgi:hypothetical protein